AARESADETVAPWEVVRYRSGTEGKFRNQQALLADLSGEARIAPRVHDIDSSAQHRDGRTRTCQSAAVRGGVDAKREARYDGEPRLAERAAERFGITFTLRRCIAAAHHRK